MHSIIPQKRIKQKRTKNNNGTITITDIVNNQQVKQIYSGYTIKQCKEKFKKHLKSLVE